MAVYFAQAGQGGAVKIGYAKNVARRISHMQVGNQEPLTVLGWTEGGPEVEQELHRRFARARLRGEWFSPTPDLLAYAGTLAEFHRRRTNGPRPRSALGRYLFEHALTYSEFARRIGTAAWTVNRYAEHGRVPGKKHMEAIIKATGGAVQPNDFYEAA